MTHLTEIARKSKALDSLYLHRVPALPPERIALTWLTARFKFSSPELAATIAELAFQSGRSE